MTKQVDFDPGLDKYVQENLGTFWKIASRFWALPFAILLVCFGVYSSWQYYNDPFWDRHISIPLIITILMVFMVGGIAVRWIARDKADALAREYYESKYT